MTSEIAIRAKNLGKQYRIGQCKQYKTLRDTIAAAAKAPFCRIKDSLSSNNRNQDQSYFWALKDVSFEIEQGEVVGIIGRNGSGKSTLLKILSRITTPTEGTAEIHGRVGSLLEVGTGFHPELTGRENIYLSGSILGMRKREIDDKFDEIVKFSEIEKFLDTPVKRYSSGMYVRLAFAVAAHLDPEILMVDEVLAVGDAAFQKKCLGKMGNIAKEGRTVLFVSHNMAAVKHLCNRCIMIEKGKISAYGETDEVVGQYYKDIDNQGVNIGERRTRNGNGDAKCIKISLLDNSMNEIESVSPGQPCYIELVYEVFKELKNVNVSIAIDTADGMRLLTLYSEFTNQTFNITKKTCKFRCYVSGLNLRPDIYSIATFLGNRYGAMDVVFNAYSLKINDSDFYNSGQLPDRSQGAMLLPHDWKMI
jgi:lipopolysaccharide transport system ATP-binding protein